MWAYQLVAPRTFELVDVRAPHENEIPEGSVVLRVEAGGICGSDLPFYKGSAPRVPGFTVREADGPPLGMPLHEVVGEVIGGKGTDLPVGARVVGWATGTNGLSEFCVTRASSLTVIDNTRPGAEAVALQPLACVINAVERIPNVAGRTVTVLGLGPIGVLFAHVLKSSGAERVVGVDVIDRADITSGFGVDETVRATARRHATRCRQDDRLRTEVVIECIGHQSGTIVDAIDTVTPGGTIYYFGIPDDDYYAFPMEAFLRKNLTLIAGFTDEPSRRPSLAAAIAYAEEWPELLPSYSTHALPMAAVGHAFERAANPAPGQLKITLDASIDVADLPLKDA